YQRVLTDPVLVIALRGKTLERTDRDDEQGQRHRGKNDRKIEHLNSYLHIRARCIWSNRGPAAQPHPNGGGRTYGGRLKGSRYVIWPVHPPFGARHAFGARPRSGSTR